MSLSDIASGVNTSIQQQLQQRLEAQAVARQIAQQQFQNVMAQKQFASNEEMKGADLAERASTHAAAAQDRQYGIANTLGDQIPAGATMQESDPAVGLMRAGGRGSLLTMKGMDAQAPPASLAAPGDDQQPQELPGTMPSSPMPGAPRLLTKSASAKQQNEQIDNERMAAAAKQTAAQNSPEAKFAAFKQQHDYEVAHPKATGGGAGSGFTGDDADSIAGAIIAGDQPPVLTGLYGKGAAVRAKLAKQGYNLASATLDWQATTKFMATANGTQQMRMHQAVDNATHSLDVIEDLAGQWKGGKFPLLNKAGLAAAKAGLSGPQAQQIATQLEAQISDVTSELGNVYMGGNSPTDHALGLAKQNLSADWTEAQLKSAINLARKNLQIRQNSMTHSGPSGASGSNPYFQGQGPTAPAVAAAGSGGGNAKTAPAADPLGIR